jgi:hypothetical protein
MSHNLLAAQSCSEQDVSDVLNISFNYGGWLPGVSVDRSRFDSINSSLYGEDVRTQNFTDSNIKNIVNPKQDFLSELRSYSQNSQTSNRAINFAGHGVRCRKPGGEITWCLVLPGGENLRQTDVLITYGGGNLLTLNEKTEKYLVTSEELLSAYPAKSLMLDSCHSGQMVIDVENNIGNQTGTFVFASTLSSNIAYDFTSSGSEEGGRLFSNLEKLLSTSDENLCKLDLNRDGKVSQREAYMGIFAANVNIEKISREPEGLGTVSSRSSQLAQANPSDRCFAIPSGGSCPGQANILETNICKVEERRTDALLNNLQEIFEKPSVLSFLGTNNLIIRSFGRGLTNLSRGCISHRKILTKVCHRAGTCKCEDSQIEISRRDNGAVLCGEKKDVTIPVERSYREDIPICLDEICTCSNGETFRISDRLQTRCYREANSTDSNSRMFTVRECPEGEQSFNNSGIINEPKRVLGSHSVIEKEQMKQFQSLLSEWKDDLKNNLKSNCNSQESCEIFSVIDQFDDFVISNILLLFE